MATQILTLTLNKPPGAKLGAQLKSVEGAGGDPAPQVLHVKSGSVADRADLREGDHLVGVGGEEIRAHDQALRLLKAAEGAVELRVRRRVASVSVTRAMVVGFEDGSLEEHLMGAAEIAARHGAATTIAAYYRGKAERARHKARRLAAGLHEVQASAAVR